MEVTQFRRSETAPDQHKPPIVATIVTTVNVLNVLWLNWFMKPIEENTRTAKADGKVPVVLYIAPWAFGA